MPRTDADRVHRRLALAAFPSLPRPAAWALQLVLWARWVGWDAWRITIRDWRRRRATGVSAVAAPATGAQSLWWALGHGLHPVRCRRFGLVEGSSVDDALAFVHEAETAAFHRLRSGGAESETAVQLLGDKDATSRILRDAGLPAAKTLGRWDPAVPVALDTLRDHDQDLVLKPNTARSARGFVRVLAGSGEPRNLRNLPLDVPLAKHLAETQRAGSAVIAQSYVRTHNTLVDLGSCDQQALVVRAITLNEAHEAALWWAFAEVPVGEHGFVVVPVTDQGIMAEPDRLSTVVGSLRLAGRAIPDWSMLVEVVLAAHRVEPFARMRSIAWDVVVGPAGPVILEGNTGWALGSLQRYLGPLLDDQALCTELLRA